MPRADGAASEPVADTTHRAADAAGDRDRGGHWNAAPAAAPAAPGAAEQFPAVFVALTDVLALHARWRSHRTALVCGDERRTWRDLAAAVNRVANGLRAGGLATGDRVAVLAGNSLSAVEVLLGVVRAGGVVVPLSGMLPGAVLARLIDDAGARWVFAERPLDALLEPERDRLAAVGSGRWVRIGDPADELLGTGSGDGPGVALGAGPWRGYDAWAAAQPASDPGVGLGPDDDFNIIYSSGTTGAPKGIVHTHHARQQFATVLALEFRFDATAVAVLTTPLSSNGTWMMLLPALAVGARTVIMPRFDPGAFLALVERERATHTFMVPTQIGAVLDHPALDGAALGSLRVLVSAGAPLAPAVKAQAAARLGGGVFELYGLTEGIATTLKPEEMDDKLASVGTPILGGDVRIVDDAGHEVPRGEAGEIVGTSPALMRGYHNRPDATLAAQWVDAAGRVYLRTGDVGRFDADGFLYVLDRKKDMILSGGLNVFPRDLEEVLLAHPAVADVAVIGVPHARWGEAPLALVVRRPDALAGPEALTPEALAAWANARLAKHQRLARVEWRDAIPRNALGKALKRELRAPYWEAAAAAGEGGAARL